VGVADGVGAPLGRFPARSDLRCKRPREPALREERLYPAMPQHGFLKELLGVGPSSTWTRNLETQVSDGFGG